MVLQLQESKAQCTAREDQLQNKSDTLRDLSAQFEELSAQLSRGNERHVKELAAKDTVINQLTHELQETQAALKDAEDKTAESLGEKHWREKMGEFEGLVGRLASTLRTKEATIQTLQGTVQRECEERLELQHKVRVALTN